MPGGGDDRLHGERGRRAQDRADIVRIGDLVEHQHDAVLGQGVDSRHLQRIGLGQHALMHRVRPELAVDLRRPDDLRRDSGVDVLLGQLAGGVLGQPQLANLTPRIGQCGRDSVPAVQDHGPVAVAFAGFAAEPGRAGFAAGRAIAAGKAGIRRSVAHGGACLTLSCTRQFRFHRPI